MYIKYVHENVHKICTWKCTFMYIKHIHENVHKICTCKKNMRFKMAVIHLICSENLKKMYASIVGDMSKSLRKHMEAVVNSPNDPLGEKNIELAKLEIEKYVRVISEAQTKLQKSRAIIKNYEFSRLNQEEKRIKNEKEKLEKAHTCINCGLTITGKSMNFPKGIVCYDCFRADGVEKGRNWGLKKSTEKKEADLKTNPIEVTAE